MTQREIARLCCKITAIYALIRSIESVEGIISVFYMLPVLAYGGSVDIHWNFYAAVFLGALPPVVLAAVAIFFWRQSGIIAVWITGRNLQNEFEEPNPIHKRVDAQELQVVAFATIGLWAIVSSISRFISSATWGVRNYLSSSEESSLFTLISQLASPVILLCLGFWLLFGARGIVQLLYKLRNVGLDENQRP